MAAKLGIMQGRLSPPVNNQIQAFPLGHWKEEFPLCHKLGLECMEWIFENDAVGANPLSSDVGINEMLSISKQYNVRINSVVADYFMVNKLFGKEKREIDIAIKMLYYLIERCHKCCIPILEIPFVDSSALRTETDKHDVLENLKRPLACAKQCGVKISLETSLPPFEFKEFIHDFFPLDIGINYDMGNSASLGYDAREEINALGEFIVNVHVKDRIKLGGTVPLGSGDTDFDTVFDALRKINYSGDFILQAAREDLPRQKQKKQYAETVKDYISFVRPFLQEFS